MKIVRYATTGAMALIAATIVGCGKGDKAAEQAAADSAAAAAAAPAPAPAPAAPLAASKPTADIMAKANGVKVPAGAKKVTGIGKPPVNVSAGAGDDDESWAEQVDVDGDGTAETADVMWDDETKTLFIYVEDDAVCAAGGTATASTLTILYGQGNAKGAAPGSGWYLEGLDATECGVANAVLYGTQFDASGNVVSAGEASFDPNTGEVVLVTAQP